MRRLLPFLLLLAAPAMCWAAPAESEPAAKNGACVYARPATTVAVAEGDDDGAVKAGVGALWYHSRGEPPCCCSRSSNAPKRRDRALAREWSGRHRTTSRSRRPRR
mgnify:CR=1 FL=1